MANAPNTPEIGRLRKLITSTVLIGFTLFVGVSCVIALASTLTQARVSSLSVDGVPLIVWKLDSVRERWFAIKEQQNDRSDELVKAEKGLSRLIEEQSAAGPNYTIAEAKLTQLLQTLSFMVKGIDTKLPLDLDSDGSAPAKVAQVMAIQELLREKGPPGVDKLLDAIGQVHADFENKELAYLTSQSQLNNQTKKIQLHRDGIKQSEESLKSVFVAIKENLDVPTRARIENALYELNPKTNWLSQLMNLLVTVQPDILSLSLVILMGVLGSSLQILHSFFRAHEIEAVGSYFLRISVGAITALVIFIVAKAGVPVIADASKLSGDAPINPYFVSFLAIISGLLSERAIVTVQNQGERFFGSGTGEPDRWARVDLTPELQQQGLTVGTLANYLGSSENDVDAIVTGKEKATAQQQQTVAIYLRRDVRELFTDIPPR